MSNLTFSIKKNRELPPFEALVGPIRGRLSDPLGRKKQVARASEHWSVPGATLGVRATARLLHISKH